MLLIKIIALQLLWYIAVFSSQYEHSYMMWPISIMLVFINFKVFKINIPLRKYILFIFAFSSWGFIQDYLLINLGVLKISSVPLWLNSLWIIFLGYYGDVFNKFKSTNLILLSILGFVGGVLSYYGGCRLSGVEISSDKFIHFTLIIGISWGLFFPITMRIFYMDNFWNWLLDRTIYFSFDSSGFKRHKKTYFNELNKKSVENTNILITGGTGGIGRNVCETLESFGAKVFFTGRNIEKGKKFESDRSKFLKLDMVNWSAIKEFCVNCPSFDSVILNAGGMPDELVKNDQGVEHQAASQLFGHYNLINELKAQGKLNKGCSITWISSGGMYLKKIDLDNLVEPSDYDKVEVYANVKRSQITLTEEMGKSTDWNDFKVFSMHPGWVGTDGLKDALPKFYKFTEKRLRNLSEGADTIVWLQTQKNDLKSGEFYFDRKIVSPYISDSYKPTDEQRKTLLNLVKKYSSSENINE